MSYFLAQIVTKAFEFRFSFFILAKRLEALARFKNRNGRKTCSEKLISFKTLKIKERQKIF
jgi:hypothetical protein